MRIWASDLDTFRWWREDEELNAKALVTMLDKRPDPSPVMLAGRAWHEYLEWRGNNLFEADTETHGYANHEFKTDSASILIDEPVSCEERVLCATPSGITISGRIDARLKDDTIVDYKFSMRPNLERFMASYQWRAYLLATGSQRFQYDVFKAAKYKADAPNVWHIKEHAKLRLYSYPDMTLDVDTLSRELAETATSAGWAGRKPSSRKERSIACLYGSTLTK